MGLSRRPIRLNNRIVEATKNPLDVELNSSRECATVERSALLAVVAELSHQAGAAFQVAAFRAAAHRLVAEVAVDQRVETLADVGDDDYGHA